MQVASSFSHAVVLAPDWDVDAFLLLGNDKQSLKFKTRTHKTK